MISKQHLEELIEQGATIYYNNTISVQDKTLDKTYQVDNGYLWRKIKNGAIKSCGYPLENLFETEEDAKWELEMTATRTETLKLPTWEKFCKAPDLEFYGAEHNLYNLFFDLKWQLWITHVIDADAGRFYNLFCERATKENYIKACRLAKKLFLGEEI